MPLADPQLPQVFTREHATAVGLSRSQCETRLARGTWRRLRRGVFCTAATWAAADARGRNRLASWAGLLRLDGDAWLSHVSAAAAHGLPLPRADSGAWLTRNPPGRTVYRAGLTVEVATMPYVDRGELGGLPITSLPRTVADCLRHCPPADALAIADAAARRHPGVLAGVARVLDDCALWPYATRAARVLPFVDGRRESALESWSAWLMHVFAVPTPQPQFNLFDARGVFLARSDFWWHEQGVAGEADGRIKYSAGSGVDLKTAERVLYDEKLREDAMRRAGVHVVRWGATHLASPQRWAADLTRELDRRSTFRGTAVPSQQQRRSAG